MVSEAPLPDTVGPMAQPAHRSSGPPTVAEVVGRAVAIADPQAASDTLASLERWFEDADEPVTAVSGLEERLAMATDGLAAEDGDPALDVAVAIVLYLAHRRDELDGDPADVLRLAARAEWKGDPPGAVRRWLEQRGVEA